MKHLTHLPLGTLALAVALAGCAQQQTNDTPSMAEQYPESQELAIGEDRAVQPSTDQQTTGASGAGVKRDHVTPDIYQATDDHRLPVMRAGRYQLVTARATVGQRYLLEQTVDVNIPPSVVSSVGEGIRYTLEQTGYQLCSSDGDWQLQWLFNRPLPSAHYELGPMALREALQVLAGDEWELEQDALRREVCYTRRDDFQPVYPRREVSQPAAEARHE